MSFCIQSHLLINGVIQSPLPTSGRFSTIIKSSRKTLHSGFTWECGLIFEFVAPFPLSLPELEGGLLCPTLAGSGGCGGVGGRFLLWRLKQARQPSLCQPDFEATVLCLIPHWLRHCSLFLILIKILINVSHKPYQSSGWPNPQAMGSDEVNFHKVSYTKWNDCKEMVYKGSQKRVQVSAVSLVSNELSVGRLGNCFIQDWDISWNKQWAGSLKRSPYWAVCTDVPTGLVIVLIYHVKEKNETWWGGDWALGIGEVIWLKGCNYH